jgi:Ca-activated chloride channel family protein
LWNLARRSDLWLLILVPLLQSWAWRGHHLAQRRWLHLGQEGRIRGDRAPLWITAFALLVVALAQPRWGRVAAPPLPPGRDVVVVVDSSQSMAARDAVPDRLGVAVDAASSFVRALAREPGNRVAVVAFAGRGVVRCPLTENAGAALEALEGLRPGDVRPGGTDLGAALAAAQGAFGDEEREQEHAGGRTVVLFSDGEDLAGSWQAGIAKLRAAAIVVHAVAVGDAGGGHPVPAASGVQTLTYRGAPVLSRRVDQTLAAIADGTGGALIPLGLATADLGDLYLKRIEPVAQEKRLVFHASEPAERYQWFVLGAVALGLAASWPGRGIVLGRARGLGAARVVRFLRPQALLVTLALVLGAVPATGGGNGRTSAASAVEAGRALYAAGRWADALAAFERAMALDPGAPVPRYDAAATLFQMARYQEALDDYTLSRGSAPSALRTRIDYGLANTALALGDIAGAIAHYDACLASRAAGAALEAVRRDAAVNRQFAVDAARRGAAPPERGPRPSPENASSRRSAGSPDDDRPERSAAGEGQGRETRESQASGRRGPGGAGGSGPAPLGATAPEARLEAALERVRESRSHRLAEPPPPAAADASRKEW